MKKRTAQAGFTLLEVMVATLIMAIAIVALMNNLNTSVRNAARLTSYDRAALLGQQKMDELRTAILPPMQELSGRFDPAVTGGEPVFWRARATVFEALPGSAPGMPILERIELIISWGGAGAGDANATPSSNGRTFRLETFRRRELQVNEPVPPGGILPALSQDPGLATAATLPGGRP